MPEPNRILTPRRPLFPAKLRRLHPILNGAKVQHPKLCSSCDTGAEVGMPRAA